MGDPETTSIEIELPEFFLEDIDAVWKEEGYKDRSEFIYSILRDAVNYPSHERVGKKWSK